MHNLKTNFDKLLRITKMAFGQKANAVGNPSFYSLLKRLRPRIEIHFSELCDQMLKHNYVKSRD